MTFKLILRRKYSTLRNIQYIWKNQYIWTIKQFYFGVFKWKHEKSIKYNVKKILRWSSVSRMNITASSLGCYFHAVKIKMDKFHCGKCNKPYYPMTAWCRCPRQRKCYVIYITIMLLLIRTQFEVILLEIIFNTTSLVENSSSHISNRIVDEKFSQNTEIVSAVFLGVYQLLELERTF